MFVKSNIGRLAVMFRYDLPIDLIGSTVMKVQPYEKELTMNTHTCMKGRESHELILAGSGGYRDIEVCWKGFTATLESLLAAGWTLQEVYPFKNWRDEANSRASNHYIYMRHPDDKLVSKIKIYFDKGMPKPYDKEGHVEFLTHEKNQRIKMPKYVDNKEYSEEDIEPMLKVISEIQAKRPRKRKELPVADVLPFIMAEVG